MPPRPRKFQEGSLLDVEVPLTLKLSERDIRKLSKAGPFGVRNSVGTVAKYALQPARDQARRISGLGIGRAEQRYRRGRGGRETYVPKGRSKPRKILAYRAGVRKKGAYAMRGRADAIGDVTLLLSVRADKDYYNYLANLWEHGWSNPRNSHPGNQFMTKAVLDELPEIRNRFARGIRAAVEKGGKRLKAADLRRLG